MQLVPGKTWLAKPAEINPQIARWRKDFPDIVRVDEEKQFSGDSVYAITVAGNNGKPKKKIHGGGAACPRAGGYRGGYEFPE